MSDEPSVDSQDTGTRNVAPVHTPGEERPAADKPSWAMRWLTGAGSGVWSMLAKLFTIGAAIWICAVLAGTYFSGFIDYWRSPTKGAIRIETPQIYTRERLVNDRFREQAWLEDKLRNLDDSENLVTTLRSRIVDLSLKRGEEGADGQADATTTEKIAAASETVSSLVDVLDAFEKAQNRRAGIRNALIENELDDRHDIGANSLYLFNFGAAVATGPRSRNPLLIEMEIEQDGHMEPLAIEVTNDESRCHRLLRFECAWLFAIGTLEDPNKTEEKWVREFGKWRTLFGSWLQFEISSYEYESQDVAELLQASSAKDYVEKILQPFYAELARKARAVYKGVDDLVATTKPGYPLDGSCTIKGGLNDAVADVDNPAAASSTGLYLEYELRREIRNCIAFVNKAFKQVTPDQMVDHLVSGNAQFKKENFEFGKQVAYDQFLKAYLRSFNEQCDWTKSIVEKAPSRGSSTPIYQVGYQTEQQLFDCIVNSIIRNFGSHPFSKLARTGNNAGVNRINSAIGDGRSRTQRSNYSTVSSLNDIFESGPGGFTGRKEFVSILSRSSMADISFSGEVAPLGDKKLAEACKEWGIPLKQEDTHFAGIMTSTEVEQLTQSYVNPNLGWSFLLPLICRAADVTPYGSKYADAFHQIPIGLFRFINVLSAERKTFSYSVLPRAEFKLEQLNTQTSWSFSDLIPGTGPKRNVNAQGKDTEARVEKRFRIIGFGTQSEFAPEGNTDADKQSDDSDQAGGDEQANQDENQKNDQGLDRRAVFGWYLLPVSKAGFIWPDQQLESANLNLSALVSLPAWWNRIKITVNKRWLSSDTLKPPVIRADERKPARKDKKTDDVETVLRVDLPVRLEFLRNHFLPAGKIGPSLDLLRIPPMHLTACQETQVVLQGERLWRSTVVTIGSQRARRIRVMPNMRGIIAEFGELDPTLFQTASESGAPGEEESANGTKNAIPLTVWTSEGKKTVGDTIFVNIPREVSGRIKAGLEGCPSKPPTKSR